jgi:hypothetical protein
LLKEREEAAKKASQEAAQRALRKAVDKASREAAEKVRRDARHVTAHSLGKQGDRVPNSLFRDP